MSLKLDQANHAYASRAPGFYVVNSETQIAVAGPFAKEWEAEAHKQSINAEYVGLPGPTVLRVYEVSAS